jgi:hypothetical protein
MRVEKSDERDSHWERHRSTFRVYFFEGSGKPYSVSTYDVTDATFNDAKIWAKGEAGPRRYSIALVSSDERGNRGLTWLVGDDANENP